jgi:fumarate reductase (CoM/CoB) subunit A
MKMRFDVLEIECDVLVVGGGVAATSAVMHAMKENADVGLAVKGCFGAVGQRGAGASSCGTTFSGRPRLPGIHEGDFDQEDLLKKIVAAGLGMADRRLARVLLEDSEAIRSTVDEWGVVWERLGPVGLGYPVVSAVESAIRSSPIELFEKTMIVDLLVHDGRCAGAVGLTERGDIVLFRAPAVVLATGGNAQLYEQNVHPKCVTGDGYAASLRAGATLMNMEFMQIFFCIPYPTRNLFHVWQREELGTTYNREGRRFLADYLPPGITVEECVDENLKHAPFSTRDRASRYLAVAIVKEVQAGRGTDHGGVYLDLPEPRGRRERAQMEFLRYRGIDRTSGPVELTMGHQCSNGGLRIDTDAMTAIPGVFAAGEATTGMHGADRIGGNMLANCLIFGARAGRSAARWAKKHTASKETDHISAQQQERIRSLAARSGSTAPKDLLSELQRSAWNNALAVRSETSLKKLLYDIDCLETESEKSLLVREPEDLTCALELQNLLLVGKAVATAALHRSESRGGHYREDFPERNRSAIPKALLLTQSDNQQIRLSEEVVDPQWQETDSDIGKERWG